MIVMKFGGTSVKDADAVRRVVQVVGRERRPRLVVVSALSKVTDALLEAARLAEQGDATGARQAVKALHRRHEEMAALVRATERRASLLAAIDALFEELEGIVRALAVVEEVSPRSKDAIVAFGELASSRIVAAALEDAGLASRWLDARAVLVTDAQHGAALPDRETTDERLRSLVRPLLADGLVPVVGGFVGATAAGLTTTLGRGGSDLSAALFGAGLAADEIQIWTDVDGMLTADPRMVAAPRVVPQLSFDEASELAYFGAKVLHPRHDPPRGGPRHPGAHPELPPPGGARHPHHPHGRGRGRRARRDRLQAGPHPDRHRLDPHAHGLRLPAPRLRGVRALPHAGGRGHDLGGERLRDHRRPPVARRHRGRASAFADVSHEDGMAIVCAVGERLRTDARLATRVLGALEGLPLAMVSQGGSRKNITVVLRDADAPAAMERLHRRFFEGETAPAGRDALATA